MRELWPWLRLLAAQRWRLALGLVLMLLAGLAGIGLLALSGWFITAAALAGLLLAAGGRPALDIYLPGGGIRAFALLRTVARYGERLWNHDLVLRLLAQLRGRLFAHSARLDVSQLARFRSAELLQRVTADVDALDALWLRALAPLLVGLLGVLAVSLLLALFAPWLGLGIGAGLLLAFALLLLNGWRQGGRDGAAVGAAGERLRQRLLEGLHGLAELRALGVIDEWRARAERLGSRALRAQARLARRSVWTEQLAQALVQLAMLAALLGGLLLYRDGLLGAPVAVLMGLAVLGLGELLAPLPGAVRALGQARRAARRLNALLARPAEAGADAGPPDASAVPASAPTRQAATARQAAPNLDLIDVTLRRDPVRPAVLDGISLHIAAGERVALIGRSGAGKSSVADLCAGLIAPTTGTVNRNAAPLSAMPPDACLAGLAYLTQRSDLFAGSLADNLRIARADADDDALWAALTVSGLDGFVHRLPDGLATWIGEGGARLSGGQARRLALARVVLKNAPLVLLDEPLSGLDAATAAVVAERLQHWLRGRTALMLAHDIQALPSADRVLRLDDARIIAIDD